MVLWARKRNPHVSRGLWKVGEPSLRSPKQEIYPYLPAAALGRVAPTLQLGNTVELALAVWVWVT